MPKAIFMSINGNCLKLFVEDKYTDTILYGYSDSEV